MRFIIFTLFLLFPFTLFSQNIDNQNIYPEKDYYVAVPLAFFVGFGSGHFYARDTWGGIRYIAYDIAGLGLGFLTLYFDDYSSRSIIFAVAIAAVNRIYQSISAAEAVYYYNKNPLIRELDIFKSESAHKILSIRDGNILQLQLIEF